MGQLNSHTPTCHPVEQPVKEAYHAVVTKNVVVVGENQVEADPRFHELYHVLLFTGIKVTVPMSRFHAESIVASAQVAIQLIESSASQNERIAAGAGTDGISAI